MTSTEFSDAMRRVVEDVAFAQDSRDAGIARAQTFTWERCAALTAKAWDRTL
jgi:alpha-1,3-rhamnosyl/mannosyltransferase